ncbi:helical backbone metal receptor [Streptomyces sp. NPDC015184]|uniref:helical backbone metal receptor n=1 Tax=Streptomyces sp. NPDC015184 TaxID=3364946 RepID=UPI0037012E36
MRVVSLVPSLTEAVAATDPGRLAGVTDWCTHPAGLTAVRIGGTKNPDVAAVLALRPDLVLANEEENRAADIAALRAAGTEVLVTEIRTLDGAFAELARVLAACGRSRPRWLDEAEAAWAALPPPSAPRRAVVPVWRRPWMVLGRDTFAGDLLARLGVENVCADHAERYPRIPLDELNAAGADLVVLPDEPYRFTAADGPEAFPALPAALVDGRYLTWYGPSLVRAPAVLRAALRRTARAASGSRRPPTRSPAARTGRRTAR